MNESQAKAEIIKRTVISRQLVTLAKARLVSEEMPHSISSREFLSQFAHQQGFDPVEHVQLNESVDP